MTSVNNLLFLIAGAMLCSCRPEVSEVSDILNTNITFVNQHADSSFFKLPTSISIDKYYEDDRGNNIFLSTRTIVSLDSNFGNANIDNIKEALHYYRTNKNVLELPGISFLHSISIMLYNGDFETVWNYQNFISPSEDGYSFFELNVSLESSYTRHEASMKDILHIMFKTTNYNGGFQLYTMNYTHADGVWKLLYREKINTVLAGENEIGYCIDTVNRNCQIEGDFFELTLNNIVTLNDRVCY
jgi:hypothetical protein